MGAYMNTGDLGAQRAVADALEAEPRPITLERVMGLIEPLLERGVITWYPGYAHQSGGPSDQPVLSADWNVSQERVPAPAYWRDDPDRAMPRIEAVLARVDGLELEWCDEGTACDSCSKWVRTAPDSYFWVPAYRLDDSGYTCLNCAEE